MLPVQTRRSASRYGLEDLEARAARGGAHRHALGGIQVEQAHAAGHDLGTDQPRLLLGCVLAVPAEGEQDRDVLRRQLAELVEQRRQELVARGTAG